MSDFNFRNPDYRPLFEDRAKRIQKMRDEPEIVAGLIDFYKDHPVEFINDWGITFDPRNAERGLPSLIPFKMFPKQEEFIIWVVDKWRGSKDGLAEKSRDMGVSWLCVAIAVWMWRFHAGTVIGFGSRKEEYVDKLGDPKSLFWKARQFIAYLPKELRPAGWDEKKYAPHMRIINPENGAAIVGEAGDNIGRGNRTSVYFKDEAQPLYSKVLTPNGWCEMRNISKGDIVLSPDGGESKVIQIKDFENRDVYRITMTDGATVECSGDHLWKVTSVIGKRRDIVLSTKQLLEDYIYSSPKGQTQYRYRLPVVQPLNFSETSLPLHPYLIGALIGDGCLSAKKGGVSFTTKDDEIRQNIAAVIPDGYSLTKDQMLTYRIVSGVGKAKGKRNTGHILLHSLKQMGLYGLLSYEKRIPKEYMFASKENRIELLQGLMDTDGSASGGVASYHTSSPELAGDVRFLVQSLGGTATLNIKPDRRGFRDMYVLHMALPSHIAPFKLQRKSIALRKRKHPIERGILRIEKVSNQNVRCITVDGDDGLYITDNCIVTHNSAFYERPESVDAALSQTSNCKLDVSTPNGNGNPFFRKRHSGKVDVFTFHWKDDPRKDEEWYRKQCELLDPVIVAQEIDIDYSASVSDVWISADLVMEAQRNKPADVEAVGKWIIGVDAAHFGDDESVIHMRKGRLNLPQITRRGVDGIQLAGVVTEQIDNLGAENVGHLIIELDGAGVSCYDQLRQGKYAAKIIGVHTGARLSDDKNYNVKAKMWRDAKQYLEDKPVCLYDDAELRVQLASVKYLYKDGLLLMQSKKDHKKLYGKSPDRADAFVLTFAAQAKPVSLREIYGM